MKIGSTTVLGGVLLAVCALGAAWYVTASPAPGRTHPVPVASADVNASDALVHPHFTVPGAAPEDAFGLVGDVATGGGRVFVLDVLEHQIGVFAPGGERLAVLGRRGSGPGELMGPVAIAVDGRQDGPLYVLDERRQGVDLFHPATGEWQRTLPLAFHATDLCFAAGRLFLLGPHGGHLVHEVDAETGRTIRSFVPDPDSEDILLQGYRGSGYLGCSPGGEIAFLPSLRPDITRISAATGAVVGTATIPDYRPVRVRQTMDGGVQFDTPDRKPHDYGSSIVPLPDGDWLVQAGTLKPRTNSHHEFTSVRSYRLSVRTGEITPVITPLPRVVASAGAELFVVRTSPFPAVGILEHTREGLR